MAVVNKLVHSTISFIIVLGLLFPKFDTLRESNSETSVIVDIPSSAAKDLTTQVDEIERNAHGNHCLPNGHVSDPSSLLDSVSNQADPLEPSPIDGVVAIQPNDHAQLSPPSPSASISNEAETQEPPPVDLRNHSKIALGLLSVSAGSLIAVVVVNFGDQNKEHAHRGIFQGFILLCLISLISDSIILLLALKCPKVPYLERTVRLTMRISVVSLSFAYIWAVSVLLVGSLMGTIVAVVSLSAFIIVFTIVCVFF